MANTPDKSNRYTKADGPLIQQLVFTFVTLFIGLIIIYGNSFRASWHYDDYTNIVENRHIHAKNLSWDELKNVVYKNKPGKEYNSRPLAFLTFAVNYYISKLDVFYYHTVNFVIHYLASIFLYLFIFRTINILDVKKSTFHAHSVALLSTFLWSTHPIQVTAVTYLVQRMASMAALFYIMSMYFYLRARTCQTGYKHAWYVLCCAAGLCSFATKENAAMLPFSLFLYDLLLLQNESGRKHILDYFKKFIFPVSIIALLAFLYTDLSSVLSGYEKRPFTLVERLLTQPRVILFYISLLAYPISSRLTLIHDIEISTSLFTPWTTLPSILFIAGLIFLLIMIAKKHPLISFCGLFFFLNHIIEGSFIGLELIYEHRNYLPSIFIFVIFSLFVLRAMEYFTYSRPIRRMIPLCVVIIIVGNSHTVYLRNYILANEGTLWQDNVIKSPGMSVVHNNLGKFYWNMDKPREALSAYEKALSLDYYMNLSQSGIVHYNMGLYYSLEEKNYQKALFHFEKALEKVDGRPEIWAEVARTNLIIGNRKKAFDKITTALRYWPDNTELLKGLSLIHYKEGNEDDALKTAQKILRSGGDIDEVLILLAEISRKKGNIKKAIGYWEKLLENNPSHIRGTIALIELYHEANQHMRLEEMIGRLMYLKKDKSFYETIMESRKLGNIKVYLPDTEKIIPIIRAHLTKQVEKVEF